MLYADPLLFSNRTHHAMIEFTTDCNMRCVYCAVSHPNWIFNTLDPSIIDDIVVGLKNRDIKYIIMHGHGETTMIDGWEKYAEYFQSHDIKLSLCTNLNRTYTDHEIDILGQFASITISIDSVNQTLFAELRKGGNLDRILDTMSKIQDAAKKHKNKLALVWSAVVCDKTLDGLQTLVKFGKDCGVKTFCFCNLTKVGDTPLHHVSELNEIEKKRAIRIIKEIKHYCMGNCLELDIKSGIMDSLLQSDKAAHITHGSSLEVLQ